MIHTNGLRVPGHTPGARMTNVYVSITGLRLTSRAQTARFYWFAVPALKQAKAAPGNISADVRTVDGVYHTLTVWETRDAMQAFMRTGAHAKAMKAVQSLGMGSTCGMPLEAAPSWVEALDLWRAHATGY